MDNDMIRLEHITKYFPGVIALKDISFAIKKGEIHGLIGENGAGKSTIIKCLTGVYQADEGDLFFDGEKVKFKKTIDAIEKGVGCVYQELNIVLDMSITDNLFLGSHIKTKFGLLDYKTMHKKASEIMKSLGIDIDPRTICGEVGIGIHQMVEIGKAMLNDVRFLIMDEPTSSLGENEVNELMRAIERLKQSGITVMFVSHKLEELFRICEVVTVMRDGEWVSTTKTSELTEEKLIEDMVGRSLENLFPKEFGVKGEEALSVKNLSRFGIYQDINFSAYRGEVLGFAGLVGAGRSELFRGIFGVDQRDQGEIFVHGKQVKIKSPIDAINNNMAFLTEDRKDQGLVLMQTVEENLMLASLDRLKIGPFFDMAKANEIADDNIQTLVIKTPSKNTPVVSLSGGNQQKVVIGKWLNIGADIYIFDEPTRGIDVGAKIEVYNTINKLVMENKCVIIISSELPEILGMADRVIVMKQGEVMAEIDRNDKHFNQESIMTAAFGGELS